MEEDVHFKPSDYEQLIRRDKADRDMFRLKDESLENSANFPDPGTVALEIAEEE